LLESLAGLCAVQSPTDHLDTVDRHAHGREEPRRVEVFATADRLDPDWRPFNRYSPDAVRRDSVGLESQPCL
jgi:hypothetical protein